MQERFVRIKLKRYNTGMKLQKGFAHIGAVIAVLVIILIVGSGVFVYSKSKKSSSDTPDTAVAVNNSVSPERPIKSIGINLDYYDPTTGMAGDIKFVPDAFNSDLDLIFHEYGMQIEANSASPARRNPQPTFIVPLGTKIMSLVDGEVVNVPKLYSNDYSVHVQPKGSDLVFETEHVINVQVKVGDTVKAGQVIAEASDYDARNYAGLGLYEIGILKPGNPPSHVCVFDYLDESICQDISAKLTALMKSWEEYRGNQSLYNEAASTSTPGCLTKEPVEG